MADHRFVKQKYGTLCGACAKSREAHIPAQHENFVVKDGEPLVHHGIGHYWCYECKDWVDGLPGRSYIDIIDVDSARDMVYVAFTYYGTNDELVATNMEVPLSKVLGSGVSLPDGPQTPWLRFYYTR
jgi:hypothetical protein